MFRKSERKGIALVALVLVGFGLLPRLCSRLSKKSIITTQILKPSPTSFTMDDLLDAIEYVESRCDVNAVGWCGGVGTYQIREIYVDDLNRILGCNRFSYEDRLDRDKSRAMAKAYILYYLGLKIQTPLTEETLEKMARIHNGGPQGYMKKCTEPYWRAVKERMRQVR